MKQLRKQSKCSNSCEFVDNASTRYRLFIWDINMQYKIGNIQIGVRVFCL